MADTPNTDTPNTPDVPASFEDLLAQYGYTAEPPTRLSIARDVLNTFRDATVARVIVAGAESEDSDPFLALASKSAGTVVLRYSDVPASKIAPHVASFAKSRKLAWNVAPLKSADGLIGRTITRKAK